jgi:hypothetical protein
LSLDGGVVVLGPENTLNGGRHQTASHDEFTRNTKILWFFGSVIGSLAFSRLPKGVCGPATQQ